MGHATTKLFDPDRISVQDQAGIGSIYALRLSSNQGQIAASSAEAQGRTRMAISRLFIVMSAAMLLTACAAPASRDAMNIPDASRAEYSADHFLSGKVSVGNVTGGQDTNPAWTSELGNTEFEGALRDSLETAYLLGPHGSAQYVLDVELMEIDQPMFGFTFTVESRIRYTLKDLQTRQTVIEEVITAEGTATSGDAFMGVKRLQMATERSAQENIKRMVNNLYIYRS